MTQKTMTLQQRLRQYRSLKREIYILQEQMAKPQITCDTVKGSSPYYPYTETVFKLTGQDVKVAARLRKRCDRLTEERLAIESEIDRIPDSRVRSIVSLRYIQGYTWDEVAAKLGNGISGDGARMAFRRYTNKIF